MKSVITVFILSVLIIFNSNAVSCATSPKYSDVEPLIRLKPKRVQIFEFPDNYVDEEVKATGDEHDDTLILDTLINSRSPQNCRIKERYSNFNEQEEEEEEEIQEFNSLTLNCKVEKTGISHLHSSSPSPSAEIDLKIGISCEEYEKNDNEGGKK